MEVKDKIILLVGASGILGSKYSKELIKSGAKLIMSDLKNKKYLSTIKKNPKAKYLFCDLRKEHEIKEMVKKAYNYYNKIDGVIFNAATTQESLISNKKNNFPKFENYPLNLWNKSIEINLTSAFLVARESCNFLKKSKGSLIFVSSTYGLVGPDHRIYKGQKFKSIPAYSASKAGLVGLARWLATWLGKSSVRVNVVTPGGVYNNHNKKFKEDYSHRTPLNRMAKPEDLVGIIKFLISDSSKYATGQNFIIDGGFTAW